MENRHPWPMGLLTRDAGERRVLFVKPNDITPRSNIRPDSNGILRIVDIDKVKLHDTIVVPETKEQGHFHFYCRNEDGEYAVYGKRQNVDGYYTDIYDNLKDMCLPGLPKETVAAIELVWPGHPDSKVPTAIKEHPEELRMKALGIPIYQGALLFGPTSLPYNRARRLMQNILPPECIVESFQPVELGDKFQSAKVLESLLALAREKGIEGYVLKERGYDGWWKLKGIREADVFVTGFKISKSDTQYGMVTAVSISCYKGDEEIDMGSVTGFDLDTKQEMTDAYEKYGPDEDNEFYRRCLRVLYQEVAGKGKLKHGFFDGWRDDKGPFQCKWEQFV